VSPFPLLVRICVKEHSRACRAGRTHIIEHCSTRGSLILVPGSQLYSTTTCPPDPSTATARLCPSTGSSFAHPICTHTDEGMHAPFSGVHMLITRLERPLDSLVRFLIAHLVHTQAELRDGIAVQRLKVSLERSTSTRMHPAVVTVFPSTEGRGRGRRAYLQTAIQGGDWFR
jgi:hypothetical protein